MKENKKVLVNFFKVFFFKYFLSLQLSVLKRLGWEGGALMHAIHEYSKMHWDVYLEFRPSNVTLFMNEATPTFVPKVPFLPRQRGKLFLTKCGFKSA